MKRILASVILLLLAATVMAQNQVPLTKQEKKAQRQEQKKQTEVMLAMNTSEALRSGHFVLKADQLRGRGGLLIQVDPTINFIAVEGKEAYVQVAPPFTGPGLNGLGGVTLKGRITSMDIERGKKDGTYNIVINTIGTAGNLIMVINMNKTGEAASASVHTSWGNRLEMYGSFYPWTGTGTYKGKETL
jgi:hypothetical protein